jgi:AraC family transcriptional regulator
MKMPSAASRREYEIRINRAMDYIHGRLDQSLRLEDLAREACFSPFHFHRIFFAITGETVMDFVWRLRLDKAASMLKTNQLPVTEIALLCGFSSASNFAKALKKRFGMNATQLRATHFEEHQVGTGARKGGAANRKPGAEVRKAGKAKAGDPVYARFQGKRRKPLQVEIRPFPGARVAYVRNLKGYNGPEIAKAWAKLCQWAGARGLLGKETMMLGIGQDNPFVTDSNKCRYDAAIVLPEGFQAGAGINTAEIPAGRYAVFQYNGPGEELELAYHDFYFTWLPQSGMAPDNYPPFEIYRKIPSAPPEGWFKSDIHVLVKPL